MRSIILQLYLLLFPLLGITQEMEVLDTLTLPNTFFVDQNITKLSEKLIEGKETDFDKFNNLFLWVVKSIQYDFRKANSPNGSPFPNLEQILKTKRGICTDIAFLMDTLCKLSQLESYIVTGFAKDNLYDIKDPIYESNHVWNAVKLGGLWYLYDATWSQGRYTYEPKLKHQKIHQWKDKLSKKIKRKKYIVKIKKSECNKRKIKEKRYYNSNTFTYKLVHFFFHKKRYKLKFKFQVHKSYNFYLTHPQVLAITHIPDNPVWLLNGEKNNKIQSFENDSAFYYLTPKIYSLQNRSGSTCSECDELITSSPIQKLNLESQVSSQFNPRNQIPLWENNYFKGDYYYQKALHELDTNLILSYIDSALFFYANGYNHLKKNIDYSKQNNAYLSKKNKKKQSELIAKNLIHLKNNRLHMNALKHRKDKVDEINKLTFILNTKSYAIKRRLEYQAEKNIRIFNGKIAPNKIENLSKKIDRYSLEIDSLNRSIDELRTSYDTLLLFSTNQVWKTLIDTARIDKYFGESSSLRSEYLIDGNKKIMADLYAQLALFEKKHNQFLYDSIYHKSDSCYLIITQYKKLIQKRNKHIQKLSSLLKDFTKLGGMDQVEYSQQLIVFTELMQEDICWVKKRKTNYIFFSSGVRILLGQKTHTIENIKGDTKAEINRFQTVSSIYKKNKKRSTTISKANIKFLREQEKVVKLKRKEILKLIK
jgi:hypothetical protein